MRRGFQIKTGLQAVLVAGLQSRYQIEVAYTF